MDRKKCLLNPSLLCAPGLSHKPGGGMALEHSIGLRTWRRERVVIEQRDRPHAQACRAAGSPWPGEGRLKLDLKGAHQVAEGMTCAKAQR